MEGFDPRALHLVRKSKTNDDPRFTPVGMDGLPVWALHPKHFNKDELTDIETKMGFPIDTTIWVDDVKVKGITTNSYSTNVTVDDVGIRLKRNFDDMTPYEYAMKMEQDFKDMTQSKIPGIWKNIKDFFTGDDAWDAVRDEISTGRPNYSSNVEQLIVFMLDEIIRENPFPDTLSSYARNKYKDTIQYLKSDIDTLTDGSLYEDWVTSIETYFQKKIDGLQVIMDRRVQNAIDDGSTTEEVTALQEETTTFIAYMQMLYNVYIEDIRMMDTDEFNVQLDTIGDYEYFQQKLVYNTEIDDYIEIDIRDLQDIDMNSSNSVTVSWGGGTTSIPLPTLKQFNESNLIIRITKLWQTYNGFYYIVNFAGKPKMAVYEKTYVQKCVLNNKQEYFHANYEQESAKKVWQPINVGIGLVTGIAATIGTGGLGSVAGGIVGGGTALTAISNGVSIFEQRMMLDAMLKDSERTSNNIGGLIVGDQIGTEVDSLINISYPVKQVYAVGSGDTKISVTPSDNAVNEVHTFSINRRFAGTTEFIAYVNEKFPGCELVKTTCEPVLNIPNYSEQFKRLVNMGALNEVT